MRISPSIVGPMVVFFAMQVGIILAIAASDLRGMGADWQKGYVTVPHFQKIIAYGSFVLLAAFFSVVLSVAYAS